MSNLTREQYRKIKRMDRRQLESFLKELKTENVPQSQVVDVEKQKENIREVLNSELGIGPGRWSKVEDKIESVLSGTAETNDDTLVS